MWLRGRWSEGRAGGGCEGAAPCGVTGSRGCLVETGDSECPGDLVSPRAGSSEETPGDWRSKLTWARTVTPAEVPVHEGELWCLQTDEVTYLTWKVNRRASRVG